MLRLMALQRFIGTLLQGSLKMPYFIIIKDLDAKSMALGDLLHLEEDTASNTR